MNLPTNLSNGPGAVDIRDPRIRITFADVAMRIARDGPMYAVIVMVGVLAIRGTTTSMESVLGAAIALQARSRPPDDDQQKVGKLAGYIGAAAVFVAVAAITSCGGQ